MKKPVKMQRGKAWAWAIRDHNGRWCLCSWAEPTKDKLLDGQKPSPKARPVCVQITAWSHRREYEEAASPIGQDAEGAY